MAQMKVSKRTFVAMTVLLSGMFAGKLAAEDRSGAAALSDPRKGEAVDRICFISELRDWNEIDDGTLLVRRGPNEWYLVTMRGACRPDLARNKIIIASRSGSPCLQHNDEIRTSADVSFGQRCTVEALYRWRHETSSENTFEK